jgi:hypothetical protein
LAASSEASYCDIRWRSNASRSAGAVSSICFRSCSR